MERREFMKAAGTGALASLVATNVAVAHDGEHAAPAKTARAMSKELQAVVDAAYDCVKKGEICIEQCTTVLQSGKATMADCQRSVLNLVAVCRALATTAAYNSAEEKVLKKLAKVCADFCRDCEKECRVHAEHHAECKACMESCITCAKACDTYARA